jgi:hypothetical protein
VPGSPLRPMAMRDARLACRAPMIAPRELRPPALPGARFCDFFVSAALTIAGSAGSLMAAMMLLWVVMAVAVRRWQSLLAVAVGRRVCLHARWGVKPGEPCEGRP